MKAEKNMELIIIIMIIKVVNTLGTKKWLAVVTDNAPVLQATWKIIENE